MGHTRYWRPKRDVTLEAWARVTDAAGNPSTGDEVFPGEEPVKVEGRFVSFLHAVPKGMTN